jgi:hypothetical protein
MTRMMLCLLMMASFSSAWAAGDGQLLERAEALPLAIDDAYEFRKVKAFFNEPSLFKPTENSMIQFEQDRVNFGAITDRDRQERLGNYFTFFWKAKKRTDLTVRFEYRQAGLGAYVQAQEVHYDDVKGSRKTRFTVIGDDYLQDGRVTAWRALLINEGRIVALTQSFLWN